LAPLKKKQKHKLLFLNVLNLFFFFRRLILASLGFPRSGIKPWSLKYLPVAIPLRPRPCNSLKSKVTNYCTKNKTPTGTEG